MLDKTFIKENLEYVKRELELVMRNQPTIEDWLWDDCNGVLSSDDAQDMIDFLDDYYEGSLSYLGFNLDNLKDILQSRKIYQPKDEDLQEEYGSFVVWLSKESVMDELCISENEVEELSVLDIEEPSYMINSDEELVSWAKDKLRVGEFETFCLGSIILKVRKTENDISIIEYATSDYSDVNSNKIISVQNMYIKK